jgi:hypothetical protein
MRNAILYSNLKYVDEESGMKIYNGQVPDVQNPEAFSRVIIRSEDEAFWNRCVERSLQDHPVCGVGNPGIGKTSTTLYLLQQLIMNQKKPVVYPIRKLSGSDIFYEFVPILDDEKEKVSDITVKVYRLMARKKSIIPTMENRNAFYVVDPGNFEGSCNDTDEQYQARFVMAASNDHRYWGANAFEKNRAPNTSLSRHKSRVLNKEGELVYGYLWTGGQVLLAKPYFDQLKNLTDNEFMDRFRIVGGSLRDILAFKENDFKEKVKTAVGLVDADTVHALADGNCQFAFKPESPSSVLIGICPQDAGKSFS